MDPANEYDRESERRAEKDQAEVRIQHYWYCP